MGQTPVNYCFGAIYFPVETVTTKVFSRHGNKIFKIYLEMKIEYGVDKR